MKSLRMSGVATAGAVMLALSSLAGVKQGQKVELVSGWNAVYITVAPDETPDQVFGAWPVDWVAAYDPATFLETKQYSGSGSTEGARQAGFVMWRRAEGPLSELKRIAANWVYVCFSTNAANAGAYSETLYGRPSAPRITWHPSSTDEPMNLIGFTLALGATTTLGEYFDGADIGNVTFQKFYRQQGGNPEQPSLSPVSSGATFKNGEVVVMTSSKVSDWSGVLNFVSIGGLDFSTNTTYQSLTLRNDGAKTRTVSLELGTGVAAQLGDVPPVPTSLVLLDTSVYTNEWRAFTTSEPFVKTLAAGESCELQIAVDRTRVAGPAGTYYGGLLTVKDTDGGSNMRVTLPVEVTSDGGASGEFAWPKGLWLVQGRLDTVTYCESDVSRDEKAGGAMGVRLLMNVDVNGKMKLLQRVVFGSDSNGVTHVYSPKKEDAFPVPIGDVKRLSSAVLPIDAPVIETSVTTNDYVVSVTNIVGDVTNVTEVTVYDRVTNGVFGTYARFDFAVGENSRVNPYLHAYHPSHDGLKWDFKTQAPSGDDMRNYVSTVKPEVFSVGNRIEFTWDKSAGTAWNPNEKLTGELTWVFSGLRHKVGSGEAAALKAKGAFAMKRISSATLDR